VLHAPLTILLGHYNNAVYAIMNQVQCSHLSLPKMISVANAFKIRHSHQFCSLLPGFGSGVGLLRAGR
jgi:hypothetical protein